MDDENRLIRMFDGKALDADSVIRHYELELARIQTMQLMWPTELRELKKRVEMARTRLSDGGFELDFGIGFLLGSSSQRLADYLVKIEHKKLKHSETQRHIRNEIALREYARAVAELFWRMDTEKEIRTGRMS